jgi:hypothetical protein
MRLRRWKNCSLRSSVVLLFLAGTAGTVLMASALAAALGSADIYDYGDTHASVGQSPPNPGPQGDHPHLQQGVTYGTSAFPLRIALRSPDARWGGAQFESRRFRFVQLFHNHRAGDTPFKGVGLITLESATGATPSVAVAVQHLRETPHIDAGPITATRIAGFSAQQFDVTIVGSDNPPACRNIRCAKGVSLVPFTANHHCGYCTHTMHGETLDAKFAAQGQLLRIIVFGVRGKTVVIYLEPLYNPNKGLFTYVKTFPTFLPYAQKMLSALRLSL